MFPVDSDQKEWSSNGNISTGVGVGNAASFGGPSFGNPVDATALENYNRQMYYAQQQQQQHHGGFGEYDSNQAYSDPNGCSILPFLFIFFIFIFIFFLFILFFALRCFFPLLIVTIRSFLFLSTPKSPLIYLLLCT